MNKYVWSIPEVHRGKSDTVFLLPPAWEPLYLTHKKTNKTHWRGHIQSKTCLLKLVVESKIKWSVK
jgi:hypothetical protein